MSKKLNKKGLMLGGALAFALNANADTVQTNEIKESVDDGAGVRVGPLNTSLPMMLAQHRSHSSHSSHRSSSGGGISTPRPSPTPVVPRSTPSAPATSSIPSAPARSEPLSQPPRPQDAIPPDDREARLRSVMEDAEKLKNIIMRVQLTLQTLDLYNGPIDGVMGPETRASINRYRRIRGLREHDRLDVETLNALAITVY